MGHYDEAYEAAAEKWLSSPIYKQQEAAQKAALAAEKEKRFDEFCRT